MAHPPAKRQDARAAYVFGRMPAEGVAEKIGVPLATVRRWKADAIKVGDDWDKARAAAAMSHAGAGAIAQAVLADYLTLHHGAVAALNEAEGLSPLDRAEAMARIADAFTKTMAAVAKAAPDLGRLAVATELLADLARFAGEKYPQHAAALLELLEPFAAHISEKYK